METRDIPTDLRQSVTSLLHKLCTDMLFQPDWRLHYENSFVQSSAFLICKLRSKRRVSSDHAGMKNTSTEVSIFVCELTEYILQLVARYNSVSYIVTVAARWTKSLKFTLSIDVHFCGLAKNHFWLVTTQKKRIGEQLNDFWNMCPKPFSWAKIKRKTLFWREVERTALSESGT